MRGSNNNSIAVQLSIYSSTVCKHLENIDDRSGVPTKLIAKALTQLGFLDALPLELAK